MRFVKFLVSTPGCLALAGLLMALRDPILKPPMLGYFLRRRNEFAVAILLMVSACAAWAVQAPALRPKLTVVIVIDQFRPDYLQRFRHYFGKGGFNLFLARGASFTEARYQHGITQTCPGHAVILTGSYASVNGIPANSWYDVSAGRQEYCAADRSVSLIGADGEGRSPRNLIDSTVGDRLKHATNGKSRVVTVAGKDRSAIMLGGHLADAVYWFQDTMMVTSTYYLKTLPPWVRRFNTSGAASSYLGRSWDRLLPAAAYDSIGPDDVEAEEDVAGTGRTFPHRPAADWLSRGKRIAAFEHSPFQNEALLKFAMAAVIEEDLGRDETPDLLAVGFSANDLIGHAYGPDSHEVMDVTVRTDRLLERFFRFLDERIGLGNVVIVLTADHGVAPLPEVVRRANPDAGAARFNSAAVDAATEAALESKYGRAGNPGWIVEHDGSTLYLNSRALQNRRVSIDEAERTAKAAVETVPGVQRAFTATELRQQQRGGVRSSATFSFYPGRSGNIYYELKPYRVPGSEAGGTTHGSPWPYDTHVPILWFGSSIVPGTYRDTVHVTDIAPTLTTLLGIDAPAGSQGRVLKEMLH